MNAPELTILAQITEQQVHQWLLARLAEIRASGLAIHHMDVTAHFYDYMEESFQISVTAHGCGECVISNDSTTMAEERLRSALGNVQERANKCREEAAALIKKARELEAAI